MEKKLFFKGKIIYSNSIALTALCRDILSCLNRLLYLVKNSFILTASTCGATYFSQVVMKDFNCSAHVKVPFYKQYRIQIKAVIVCINAVSFGFVMLKSSFSDFFKIKLI